MESPRVSISLQQLHVYDILRKIRLGKCDRTECVRAFYGTRDRLYEESIGKPCLDHRYADESGSATMNSGKQTQGKQGVGDERNRVELVLRDPLTVWRDSRNENLSVIITHQQCFS